MSHFEKVKQYLLDLNYEISEAVEENEIFVINDPEKGVVNMVLDCESGVLIVEQVICPIGKNVSPEQFKQVLQCNRSLVHGAFVIDEEAEHLIYRDTLALDNMDVTELEASINALTLGLAENYNVILEIAGISEQQLAN